MRNDEFIKQGRSTPLITGYDLGLAVVQSMLTLWKELGFPTTLKDCGATPAHLDNDDQGCQESPA
jgi:hypothetical protein